MIPRGPKGAQYGLNKGPGEAPRGPWGDDDDDCDGVDDGVDGDGWSWVMAMAVIVMGVGGGRNGGPVVAFRVLLASRHRPPGGDQPEAALGSLCVPGLVQALGRPLLFFCFGFLVCP